MAANHHTGTPARISENVWFPLLVALCFLYAWLWIEPTLQYHALSPVFFLSRAFFREHLAYPGGLVDYASNLVLQFYRISWAGALITTGLAACLGLLTRRVLTRTGWSRSWFALVGPGALLLMAQADYAFAWMQPVLAVLLALVFAAVYACLIPGWGKANAVHWRSSCLRLCTFVMLSIPVYYLAAGGFLIFTLTCALLESARAASFACQAKAEAKPGNAFPQCRWLCATVLSAAYFAVAGLVPWTAAKRVFVISLPDAYALHLPLMQAPVPAILLFVLVPGCLLAFNCRELIRLWTSSRKASPPAAQASSETEAHAPRKNKHETGSHRHGKAAPKRPRPSFASHLTHFLRSPRLSWLPWPVVWLALGALGIACSIDGRSKLLAQIEYHAQHQQWTDLLKYAARLHSVDAAAISDINRALSQTGTLLDDMFRFPQRRGLEFWLNLRPFTPRKKLQKSCDLLFELGQVNRAERMAFEALELSGYQPATLERIYQICLLKGEPQNGRPFLNLLSQTVWHRDAAERYRRELESDPALSHDSLLNEVRPLMLTRDHLGVLTNTVLLQTCLRQNPGNRMALQYLVATWLLDRQLDQVARNVSLLDHLNRADLPRHVEEALLLAEMMGGKVDLQGRTLSPATVERFKKFKECYAPYETNPLLGETQLTRDFGDTYWYYYIFGHSGAAQAARSRTNQP